MNKLCPLKAWAKYFVSKSKSYVFMNRIWNSSLVMKKPLKC